MPGKTGGSKPATRAELRSVEKRLHEKIDSSVQRLAAEAVRNRSAIEEIQRTMSTKDDIGRVLSAIDAFAREGEHYNRAAVLHGQALTEHSVQLKDHDKRIVSLESSQS